LWVCERQLSAVTIALLTVNSRHQNQCISLQGVKNSCAFLGVDRGGLRREWFELLCKALFSHESGFFTRFNKDDPQALVS